MVAGTRLDAPIVAVTVFRDGARVQRSGTVNAEPGLRPLYDLTLEGERVAVSYLAEVAEITIVGL